jgi:hypothetical protein
MAHGSYPKREGWEMKKLSNEDAERADARARALVKWYEHWSKTDNDFAITFAEGVLIARRLIEVQGQR